MFKRCAILMLALLAAGCSSVGIGFSLPIGPFGGVGVSVDSSGRVSAGVSVGSGGVSVGVGGSTTLPPGQEPRPGAPQPAASAPLLP